MPKNVRSFCSVHIGIKSNHEQIMYLRKNVIIIAKVLKQIYQVYTEFRISYESLIKLLCTKHTWANYENLKISFLKKKYQYFFFVLLTWQWYRGTEKRKKIPQRVVVLIKSFFPAAKMDHLAKIVACMIKCCEFPRTFFFF